MKSLAPAKPVSAVHASRPVKRTRGLVLVKATAGTSLSKTCTEAVDLLKSASKDPSVDKHEVFKALRTIQKENLPGDDWGPIIGCDKYWRLVYTASKDTVQASMSKKTPEGTKLAGYYFPLTAAQRFNLNSPPNGELRNGVYLPHVAALQFAGSYTMSKKKLNFNFSSIAIKLGPLKLGPFNIGGKGDDDSKSSFFIFFYADEEIICAQGKGGGIAFWRKAEQDFVLKKGLDI